MSHKEIDIPGIMDQMLELIEREINKVDALSKASEAVLTQEIWRLPELLRALMRLSQMRDSALHEDLDKLSDEEIEELLQQYQSQRIAKKTTARTRKK